MPRVTRQTKSVTAAAAKAKALAAAIEASAGSKAIAPAPTLLFKDAAAWEHWLEENYRGNETGVLWLKIAKKCCLEPTVKYDEAVELALCFGWIDGQRKALDDNFFIQRFTPRRRRSIWSKRNVARVALLKKAGKMRPSGQAEVDAAMADGRWEKAY